MRSGGTENMTTPVMSVSGKTDLVQDVLTDCSVVASLCATTSRLERGLDKVQPFLVALYWWYLLTNRSRDLFPCRTLMTMDMEIPRSHLWGSTYFASTSMDVFEKLS